MVRLAHERDAEGPGPDAPGRDAGTAARAPGGRGGRRHLTRHCPVCHRLMRPALRRAAVPLPQESGEEQDSGM
ncbi:DUF6274 family protein [Actinacidiphila glaucinigra]|uniref:DUF6274 family protein n=1 Tax=Actinacidiphila glaucinigra TaxID=235986 RepID=UPI002E374B5E|nr:DUF6274 family protein [Actinacidiphila glaucinigra]